MKAKRGIGSGAVVVILVVAIVIFAGVAAYAFLGARFVAAPPTLTNTRSSESTAAGGTSTSSSSSSASVLTASSSTAPSGATSSQASSSASSSSQAASSAATRSTSSSSSSSPSSPLTIADSAIAKGIDPTTNSTVDRTQTISPTDEYAYSWLNFTNILPPAHNVTFIWVSPQNTEYYNASYVIASPGTGHVWASEVVWVGIYVSNHTAAQLPGTWHVDIYINGTEALVQTFTMTGSSSAVSTLSSSSSASSSSLSSPLTIGDVAIVTAVNQTSGVPSGRTQTISPSATSAYAWVNFTNVSPPAHNVTFIWVSPRNAEFFNSTVTLPNPGTGQVYASIAAWDDIFVAGYPAAQLPGTWHVEIYVDGVEATVLTFTMTAASSQASARPA